LCDIQVIYGFKVTVVRTCVHFLPKGIYIVFVYMNSNTLGGITYHCLITDIYHLSHVEDLESLCLLSFVLSTCKWFRVISNRHTILCKSNLLKAIFKSHLICSSWLSINLREYLNCAIINENLLFCVWILKNLKLISKKQL
jgi:hypothetical protein